MSKNEDEEKNDVLAPSGCWYHLNRVNNEILGFANQDKFAGPDQFAEPIYAQPAIVNVQQNITQLPDFDHDSVFCKCPWCGHEVR